MQLEQIALEDKMGKTALHYAAVAGHEKIVSLLVRKMQPAEIALQNISQLTSLELAIQKGHDGVANILQSL